MKKNGLAIAGGILEIIAGALWLYVVIVVNGLANIFGATLKFKQFLVPFCLIILGIVVMTPKGTKSTLITNGILNLGFIGLQFYLGNYVGLGIVQIVLLLIASLLLFFASGNVSKENKPKDPNLPKM